MEVPCQGESDQKHSELSSHKRKPTHCQICAHHDVLHISPSLHRLSRSETKRGKVSGEGNLQPRRILMESSTLGSFTNTA
jgi:hypothetical protein